MSRVGRAPFATRIMLLERASRKLRRNPLRPLLFLYLFANLSRFGLNGGGVVGVPGGVWDW